ncbi:hypothetical protein Z517_01210 [Fonsecaea pedrosoi CBS 271.37]|uniref:Unplaced genomic scaffold supercont1.1, whole genome shotgun sequence n=1 Tax=Fonsecaea pedrosoi CBS 271.37 TaxID=1442368 RepID=A0A0D2GXK1_9EURO|nr:uncharacterized protein Z517_01210 [Fonsecaea pedrosoi CBS 271.37]KIW85818.1 hypothetical protein Z517_01210 [Fonsecaea pedrosoi CBS 271.37]
MQAEKSITVTGQADGRSQTKGGLPKITEVLAMQLALPLPLPQPCLCRRLNPLRSNSLPMLGADQLPLDQFQPAEDPILLSREPVRKSLTCSIPTHEQPLTPPPSVSSHSSVCSSETDIGAVAHAGIAHLQTLLDLPEPKLADAVRVAKELLRDSAVMPAYNQGWFRPNAQDNKFNKRIEDRIAGKSLDELVEGFFHRDEARELYGERVSKPRKVVKRAPSAERDGMEDLDPELRAKKKRRQEADEAHRMAENDRRDRHRESQMESHRRCPELAAECGAEHAKAEKKSKIQSGKGPGKDDQLWSAIYAHEMAGRVVQSVNDRRRRAEEVVQVLLRFLIQQKDLLGGPQRRFSESDPSSATSFSHPCHVGRKRSQDDMEQDLRRIRSSF